MSPDEIEIGRIGNVVYALVQFVDARHSETGDVIERILLRDWPDRIECQLFDARRRIADLEQAVARKDALLHDLFEGRSIWPPHGEASARLGTWEATMLTDATEPPIAEEPAADDPSDPALTATHAESVALLPFEEPPLVAAPSAPPSVEVDPERPYYCPACAIDFSMRKYPQQAISRHLKRYHTPNPDGSPPPERPYYCATCDMDFTNHRSPRMALAGHLRNARAHKQRTASASEPETAAEDDRATPQPIDLQGDIELAHRMQSNWPRPCPVCWHAGREKELAGPRAMKQHLVEVHQLVVPSVGHTGERPTVIPNALASIPKAPPIRVQVSCVVCRRTFDGESALDRHRCRPIEMPRIIVAPPAVQLAPNRHPFGAPIQIAAKDGWACAACNSAVFAPSVKNPKVCQRCISVSSSLPATG